MPNYHYIEDFVSDESFQKWVLSKDKEGELFWEKYMKENPSKKDVIHQAAKVLQSLHFTEQLPTNIQEDKVWQQINRDLSSPRSIPTSPRKLFNPLQIAASVLILLGLGLWLGLQVWQPDQETISTTYGEIQEVYLPDSSLVTLNGNSTLRFDHTWETDANREVWLEGEGFFEVKKREAREEGSYLKFTVHTSKLSVEVLGTAFNVSDRKDKTQVILTEGNIALKIGDEVPVQMNPGERFAIQGESRTHETHLEDVTQWSSWKEEELIFQKQSLRDIASHLQNTYGYRIEFPSEKIAEEKFTTRIHRKDIELLFPLIARSFNLSYTAKGKVIRFESNKHP